MANNYRNYIPPLILAMRPYQWIKGVFIVLPMIFGQKLFDRQAFWTTTAAFFLFGLIASSIYLINDVIDINEDREHPEKKYRPVASGKVKPAHALITSGILLILVIPTAFYIDWQVGCVLISYLILNLFYLFYLKHAVIIDVFCLGAFFYLRLLAGGFASNVELSNWIIMTTVLLALFLGFNKRKNDLEHSNKTRPVFSKYSEYFIDRMITIISSALVICYSLYVLDPVTIERFHTENFIYSIPFVYYGIFRYIYLIDTKWFGGDPARIILGDYKIQLAMILWICYCGSLIYFNSI